MIADYAFWRPANRGDLEGVHGVIRYLSHDPKKAVTAGELAELWHWGKATALVFEDAAQRAAEGRAAGAEDGKFCLNAVKQLAVPPGAEGGFRPVYAPVDFDVPDYAPDSTSALLKLGPVGQYLVAFGKALEPAYGWGAYGGYWLVRRCWHAGLTRRLMQTVAWSPAGPGGLFPHVSLYQPGTKILDGNADLDLAGVRDWGQFRRHTAMLTGREA